MGNQTETLHNNCTSFNHFNHIGEVWRRSRINRDCSGIPITSKRKSAITGDLRTSFFGSNKY